jgi:hypothetical protein
MDHGWTLTTCHQGRLRLDGLGGLDGLGADPRHLVGGQVARVEVREVVIDAGSGTVAGEDRIGPVGCGFESHAHAQDR